MCTTITSHSFSVSTSDNLLQDLESLSIAVRIDYLNCTDFTSTLGMYTHDPHMYIILTHVHTHTCSAHMHTHIVLVLHVNLRTLTFYISVSDTIVSLPTIGGMGGSIDLRVEVNTSVIADGIGAQIVFTPTSDVSVSPVTTTAQVSGGVLFVRTSRLNPDTEYSYTITFDGIDGSRLGGMIQGVFRTNSMFCTGMAH